MSIHLNQSPAKRVRQRPSGISSAETIRPVSSIRPWRSNSAAASIKAVPHNPTGRALPMTLRKTSSRIMHLLDSARRGAHALYDPGAFESRSRRRGCRLEFAVVCQDDFAVGADIHKQRWLSALSIPAAKHARHRISANEAAYLGKHEEFRRRNWPITQALRAGTVKGASNTCTNGTSPSADGSRPHKSCCMVEFPATTIS